MSEYSDSARDSAVPLEVNSERYPPERSDTEQATIRVGLPLRNKVSILQAHGRTRSIPAYSPQICSICNQAFEEGQPELSIHLRHHLDEFYERKGGHRCNVCMITFTHEQDLLMHYRSAASGHCGLKFPHLEPCSGHHPKSHDTGQNNWDEFRYCVMLRQWEQSQLQAFRSELDVLIKARQIQNVEVYSLENCYCPSYTTQLSGLESLKTFASAPCDEDTERGRDITGLLQRLRLINSRSKAQGRWSVAKGAEFRRNRKLDRALLDPTSECDIPKVTVLLRRGAQPNIDVLNTAITKNQEELVGLFLKHGANVNSKSDPPLVNAICAGKVEIVKMLLIHGANVKGWNQASRLASVEMLLRVAAEPELQSKIPSVPRFNGFANTKGQYIRQICDLLMAYEVYGPD